MSVVVYNEATGQFLDQSRGESRAWTRDLAEAQVFPSEGKAKIAYNHATAYLRRQNAWNARWRELGHAEVRTDWVVPPFMTRKVKVVLE